MEIKNNENENRIKKFFKSIVEAVTFAKANKDKSPKVGGNYQTNDYYVSYLLNQKSED